MNTYFKIVANRLIAGSPAEDAIRARSAPDDDTKELIALMDHIPNARSVAIMYRQMMKSGLLEKRFNTGDPGRRWLEIERMILDREIRRKGNKCKLIWMLIIFILVGITSYFGGVYLLTRSRHLAVQAFK
ncbi:hypothetical protein HGH93_11515 [Chitinophaga polysaccharea]|uniref:hypothetical protein n=1 Tax=Chitinophaga polysaccharea TaxID=1293035 RepID=UPI0014554233|nr:hypothetical protein [Chitinophaga polysaccharea]NLR58735.1 hypothetical protein [Chitinophaga polysaccharea]